MERLKIDKDSVVTVDFARGEIAEIYHKDVPINEGRTPLFSLKFREKTGDSRVVESTECDFCSYENGRVKYTHKDFQCELKIQEKEEALTFRISVKNNTNALLEWAEIAPLSIKGKLKDEEGGKGEIVYPYNEGCLVTNMAYRESMPFAYTEPEYPSKGSYSIFPNMISSQFIAYIADGVGVYLGMHDEERTTKHIDFRYDNENIRVFMRTFCDVGYGQDYEMPFDYVLQVFQGEWYAAADIYYDWFTKHLPNGLKKIKDNETLPKWYQESPLIVAYPIRGEKDTETTDNGMFPYSNAFPILEELAKETDSKVMALLMHWEGTAPWAPPYMWPPYGGENVFAEFVDEAHSKDMLVGLYCSGMGWTMQSNIIAEYNCEKLFEELGMSACVCANSDGSLESVICTAQRKGYDLCPSCAQSKTILKTEFDKLCASGIDYVQALDQNHGGGSYFCYSDQHGHPPAPGKWQQIETNKMLASIDRKQVLFGCESAAAEPFLSALQFSDNRYELNYYVGMPVPLYGYLYHEYVNNFMGNQICAMLGKSDNNFTYRLAYSFSAGDMLTVVINGRGEFLYSWCDGVMPLEKRVEKAPALALIKNLNGWRKKAGKNFLHFGKMIPPIPVQCGKERFVLDANGAYLVTDSVVTSAFAYQGKKVQFIVNYNLQPVDIAFGKAYNAYMDSDLTEVKKGVEKLTLAPLTAIMIELED